MLCNAKTNEQYVVMNGISAVVLYRSRWSHNFHGQWKQVNCTVTTTITLRKQLLLLLVRIKSNSSPTREEKEEKKANKNRSEWKMKETSICCVVFAKKWARRFRSYCFYPLPVVFLLVSWRRRRRWWYRSLYIVLLLIVVLWGTGWHCVVCFRCIVEGTCVLPHILRLQ